MQMTGFDMACLTLLILMITYLLSTTMLPSSPRWRLMSSVLTPVCSPDCRAWRWMEEALAFAFAF